MRLGLEMHLNNNGLWLKKVNVQIPETNAKDWQQKCKIMFIVVKLECKLKVTSKLKFAYKRYHHETIKNK